MQNLTMCIQRQTNSPTFNFRGEFDHANDCKWVKMCLTHLIQAKKIIVSSKNFTFYSKFFRPMTNICTCKSYSSKNTYRLHNVQASPRFGNEVSWDKRDIFIVPYTSVHARTIKRSECPDWTAI
jgi:hypothetical protein